MVTVIKTHVGALIEAFVHSKVTHGVNGRRGAPVRGTLRR